jgi:hypothetical protein
VRRLAAASRSRAPARSPLRVLSRFSRVVASCVVLACPSTGAWCAVLQRGGRRDGTKLARRRRRRARYDWERELATTDEDYVRWTQWIFLKLFEKGLASQSEKPVRGAGARDTGSSRDAGAWV